MPTFVLSSKAEDELIPKKNEITNTINGAKIINKNDQFLTSLR